MGAEQLIARNVSVFYDLYEKADLWGKDLYAHLSQIYQTKARYTLMFCSQAYSEKLWTNHERKSAQARAFADSAEYILPAKFDDTEIPGLLPTTGFIDLRHHSPVEVALLICQKLGIDLNDLKGNQVASPHNPAMTGEASFDYSNYEGKFRIGDGLCEFETKWNKASNRSIHCCNDLIQAVAVACKDATITELADVLKLDFTSRVRTVHLNQFVVIRNRRGVYALLQIKENSDDTCGAEADRLKFQYWILPDGGSDFSCVKVP